MPLKFPRTVDASGLYLGSADKDDTNGRVVLREQVGKAALAGKFVASRIIVFVVSEQYRCAMCPRTTTEGLKG